MLYFLCMEQGFAINAAKVPLCRNDKMPQQAKAVYLAVSSMVVSITSYTALVGSVCLRANSVCRFATLYCIYLASMNLAARRCA